jgi:phosphoribosylanthranilate isomerase
MTAVKICGLSEPVTLKAACKAGARFVGFVFHPASPRHLSFDTAATLAREVPTGIRAVALFVDPDDALLERILGGIPLDMIQLHGEETPARVAEIRAKFNMPVMKAIRVATAEDLAPVPAFEAVADWLLFDTKSSEAPGGTGHAFNWTILKNRRFTKPWMLGGGLTAENVGQALSILKPDAVDVSSGVESARGIKDEKKIRAFIEAVRQGDA